MAENQALFAKLSKYIVPTLIDVVFRPMGNRMGGIFGLFARAIFS